MSLQKELNRREVIGKYLDQPDKAGAQVQCAENGGKYCDYALCSLCVCACTYEWSRCRRSFMGIVTDMVKSVSGSSSGTQLESVADHCRVAAGKSRVTSSPELCLPTLSPD